MCGQPRESWELGGAREVVPRELEELNGELGGNLDGSGAGGVKAACGHATMGLPSGVQGPPCTSDTDVELLQRWGPCNGGRRDPGSYVFPKPPPLVRGDGEISVAGWWLGMVAGCFVECPARQPAGAQVLGLPEGPQGGWGLLQTRT